MKLIHIKTGLAKIHSPKLVFSISLGLLMFPSLLLAEDGTTHVNGNIVNERQQEARSDRRTDFTDKEKAQFRAFGEEMREKTKDMTPEERREYRQKRVAERMQDMSPEQREKIQARIEERKLRRQKAMRKKFQEMSPDERQAFREAHMAERMNNMSPEEREKFQVRMEKRKQIHDKIKDMSPEERKSFREAQIKEKMKGMTPTEKDAFRQRLKQWEGRRSERRSSRNGGMRSEGRGDRRGSRNGGMRSQGRGDRQNTRQHR